MVSYFFWYPGDADKLKTTVLHQQLKNIVDGLSTGSNLVHYAIAGKKFWNLFHLQPMRDQKVAELSIVLRSRMQSDSIQS